MDLYTSTIVYRRLKKGASKISPIVLHRVRCTIRNHIHITVDFSISISWLLSRWWISSKISYLSNYQMIIVLPIWNFLPGLPCNRRSWYDDGTANNLHYQRYLLWAWLPNSGLCAVFIEVLKNQYLYIPEDTIYSDSLYIYASRPDEWKLLSSGTRKRNGGGYQ